MEEDQNLTHFAVWICVEGEEHVTTLLHNESSLVGSENINLATDVRVPGRVKGQHSFYKEIGADEYIVSVVEKGYRLVFDEVPPPSFTRNNKSALSNKEFVYKELLRLESLGCIKRVKEQPYVVLPLSAVSLRSGD